MTAPRAAEVKVSHVLLISLFLIVAGWSGFSWFYNNAGRTLTTQPAANYETGPEHVATIYGEENAFIGETRSVYVAGKRIYVSDTSNHRVLVFDYNGRLLLKFGDEPQGDWHGMSFPYGLTVVDDRVYVADAGLKKILMFDLEGRYVENFAEEVLVKPINIVYRDNHFYLTDVERQQIVILDRDGNEVRSFGRYGKEGKPGQFNYPNGLAVDDNGRIFVADTNNSRIQIFDNEGKYLASWTGEAGNSGGIVAPMNIAFDSNNFLYVTDPVANRVVVFNGNGETTAAIRYVPEENGTSFLGLPSGVYIDPNRRLYISDTGNRRLVIFKLEI